MNKPPITVQQARAAVARYIRDYGLVELWPVFDRLDDECKKMEQRDDRLAAALAAVEAA